MTEPPWRVAADGILVAVRLTPRAPRDRLAGAERLADGRTVLAVRVRAVPEKGKANAALEALLAEALGVPRSAVAVVAGGASRLKSVAVTGNAQELEVRMRVLAANG